MNVIREWLLSLLDDYSSMDLVRYESQIGSA